MPTRYNRATDEGDDNPVVSPFAQTTSSVRPGYERGKAWPLWIFSGVMALVILGSVGYFVFEYLNDPYRILEPFSVDNYLADFQPLTGSKFKAELKVEADLGWKENIGRLMVFTARNGTRPVLVLIPTKLSGIFFTKGQTYQVSLEVQEGGLIYADSCEKE